jgi:hypothetical protein
LFGEAEEFVPVHRALRRGGNACDRLRGQAHSSARAQKIELPREVRRLETGSVCGR